MTLKISTATLQKYYSIFFIILPYLTVAQCTFDDDVNDVPINDYIYLGIALGAGLIFYLSKKTSCINSTK